VDADGWVRIPTIAVGIGIAAERRTERGRRKGRGSDDTDIVLTDRTSRAVVIGHAANLWR